ncbi:MAG: TonB-dependent siderophore receptor [Acidobacteria bacterium]|nr:TonB-dependent siderophore receptor [Acidobacteriota bacterium]
MTPRVPALVLALLGATASPVLAGGGSVESAPAVEVGAAAAGDPGDSSIRAKGAVTVTAPPEGYAVGETATATKTDTPLLDVPQSVTIVARPLMQDQLMTSIGDVVRYVPGVTLHQGENNRDQIVMRGNSSSADFFVDGVRDDVQYYRDLYNLERVEALKGPNAMIFGRGGAGGVINRVTKQAGFTALREVDLQGGSYGNKRANADFDAPLSNAVALRLNGLYEDSGSFRNNVDLTRWGFAPSLAILAGEATSVTVSYERFHDGRTADRGITSYRGAPADVPVATYYGNPDDSSVRADVNLLSAAVEHRAAGFTLRNRTLYGDYDRGYQNYVPGAASSDMSAVLLTAYNNATKRQNLFNQTDLTSSFATGPMKHTLLVGAELGRQLTDNFRNTGYFNNTSLSISVPFASPQTTVPVTWRQSATDADNHLVTKLFGAYVQDQVELTPALQLLGGVRFDRFDLTYTNNRNGDEIGRVDNLVSPRFGVVVKPAAPVSLYAGWTVSWVPGSGDQFSSLTNVTQQLEPEKIVNYEVGAKWDPSSVLALTLAVYRLDRTNTRSTDPNDPTRIVQTGSQRTNGIEIGATGRITGAWSIAGGYAFQDAFVTSATVAAREGAIVAQVPRHTFSLWNQVQVHPKVGAALGVVARSAMYAAIDDAVTLPGCARLDAAVFVTVATGVRVQLNVENLLDRRYYANADSNTNISPGSPRAARLGLMARF